MKNVASKLLPAIAALLFTACTGNPAGEARPVAWRCSDRLAFDATSDDISARLALLGDTRELPRQESASGARYAGSDTVFWIKGREAMLELDGREYECRIDRMIEMARDAGVDFRGIGQEPGWILDVYEGHGFDLQYDYGQQRARLPWAEPDLLDDGTRVWFVESEGESMKVVIEPGLCHDAMSGQAFGFAVRVAFHDMNLSGSGREL